MWGSGRAGERPEDNPSTMSEDHFSTNRVFANDEF